MLSFGYPHARRVEGLLTRRSRSTYRDSMNKFTLLVILILLLLLSFFISKAEAEAPVPTIIVPAEIASDPVKSYAYKRVYEIFGETEWQEFDQVIIHESHWDCTAQNPRSSAYGLGQLLTGTRKDLGFTKSTNCFDQVEETIAYVKDRYKTPTKAWDFWKKYQSY